MYVELLEGFIGIQGRHSIVYGTIDINVVEIFQ